MPNGIVLVIGMCASRGVRAGCCFVCPRTCIPGRKSSERATRRTATPKAGTRDRVRPATTVSNSGAAGDTHDVHTQSGIRGGPIFARIIVIEEAPGRRLGFMFYAELAELVP